MSDVVIMSMRFDGSNVLSLGLEHHVRIEEDCNKQGVEEVKIRVD